MVVVAISACGPAIDVQDTAGSGDASDDGSSSMGTDTTPRPDTSDPDPTTRPDPSTTTVGPDPDPSTTETRPEPPPGFIGGNYLLVVSTVISPEFPFQYLVVIDPNVDETGQQSAQAWPLSLYVNSTDMPRERLEPPVPFDVIAAPDVLAFGFAASVPGEANPITGSDVSAVLSFEGTYFPERDFACGDVFGEVTEPISTELSGSTFSLIPIVDGLPAPFPLGCE
jgi:hypothetical protein